MEVAPLANVANALPALTSDSPRFFAGYAAMLEELNLLLVATKPYGKDDFKTAALTMLKARAGKALDHLHIADPELYLSTSGMGAVLSMGLDAAGVLNGSTHFTTLTGQAQESVYFEVPGFLNEVPSRFLDHLKLHQYHGEGMDGKKVLMAWLNGSAPERKGISDKINNWDAQKLVQKMLEWLETSRTSTDRPTVLVLDATIETPGPDGTSDLAVVLDGLDSSGMFILPPTVRTRRKSLRRFRRAPSRHWRHLCNASWSMPCLARLTPVRESNSSRRFRKMGIPERLVLALPSSTPN